MIFSCRIIVKWGYDDEGVWHHRKLIVTLYPLFLLLCIGHITSEKFYLYVYSWMLHKSYAIYQCYDSLLKIEVNIFGPSKSHAVAKEMSKRNIIARYSNWVPYCSLCQAARNIFAIRIEVEAPYITIVGRILCIFYCYRIDKIYSMDNWRVFYYDSTDRAHFTYTLWYMCWRVNAFLLIFRQWNRHTAVASERNANTIGKWDWNHIWMRKYILIILCIYERCIWFTIPIQIVICVWMWVVILLLFMKNKKPREDQGK